jgi:hypothetical protein
VIELIVLAIAIAAAAGATTAVVARRRKRARDETKALPPPRKIERGELKPKDVVAHLGTHYLVDGVAELDEGAGPSVVIAEMHGEDHPWYLVIEPGSARPPVLAVSRDPTHAGNALPRWLHEGNLECSLVKRAAAQVSVVGDLDTLPPGPCNFGRYEGPGGRVGLVVVSGSRELALMGKTVTLAGLTLLPGGDAS